MWIKDREEEKSSAYVSALARIVATHRPADVPLQFARELWVWTAAASSWKAALEGGVQDLIQVLGQDEVQVGPDVGRKLFQVLLVALGEDEALYSCPVGGQHLVFDPAHLTKSNQ